MKRKTSKSSTISSPKHHSHAFQRHLFLPHTNALFANLVDQHGVGLLIIIWKLTTILVKMKGTHLELEDCWMAKVSMYRFVRVKIAIMNTMVVYLGVLRVLGMRIVEGGRGE